MYQDGQDRPNALLIIWSIGDKPTSSPSNTQKIKLKKIILHHHNNMKKYIKWANYSWIFDSSPFTSVGPFASLSHNFVPHFTGCLIVYDTKKSSLYYAVCSFAFF